MYELLFHPDADAALSALETDRVQSGVLASIRGVLGHLERDAFNPRLGTRQFQSPQYGHIRATPATSNWFVLWQPGNAERSIEIVHIIELRL
ncbi:MAG: hypothetical protein WKF86_04865 [Acidimicrobiales bacterium]